MWTNAFMKQFVWISTFLYHSKTGINPKEGFCHEYFLQLIEFCFPVTSFDRITVSPLQLVSKPNRVRFIASAWVWWVLVRFVQPGRINTNAPWLRCPGHQARRVTIYSDTHFFLGYKSGNKKRNLDTLCIESAHNWLPSYLSLLNYCHTHLPLLAGTIECT